MRLKRILPALAVVLFVAYAFMAYGARDQASGRIKGAFRKPAENGWTYVHLEGAPGDIGYQHGYLLAAEIVDAQKVVSRVPRNLTPRR